MESYVQLCRLHIHMKPALTMRNHFLLPKLLLFTKESPEYVRAFYSTIHEKPQLTSTGEERLQIMGLESEPDPALLHLGCRLYIYIYIYICKEVPDTSHLFSACLCLFQSLQFLPFWLHNPPLISESGILSLVTIQMPLSDFLDSSFWHWFQLCWLLRF